MYRVGSICLGLSMLVLQGCSDSNVEVVREAKYNGGKHKIGVILDNRKECDDQKWESIIDASDNVTVTILCTFELSDAAVERSLAATQDRITTRKENLLQSYFNTRKQVEQIHSQLIEHIDQVKSDYETRISNQNTDINNLTANLESMKASGEQQHVIQSYAASIDLMKQDLEDTQSLYQENIADAQKDVASRKNQMDYLISIEEKIKSTADEFANDTWATYESELKKNTKITNIVAFELSGYSPELVTYKTVSRSEYLTKEEMLDRRIEDNRTGAQGLAIGLLSSSDTTAAKFFTEQAERLTPGFTGQLPPEPFSCSIHKDGAELCVFE